MQTDEDDVIPGENLDPLNLLDKDEFWEVAKKVSPGILREDFDSMWKDLVESKDRRTLN